MVVAETGLYQVEARWHAEGLADDSLADAPEAHYQNGPDEESPFAFVEEPVAICLDYISVSVSSGSPPTEVAKHVALEFESYHALKDHEDAHVVIIRRYVTKAHCGYRYDNELNGVDKGHVALVAGAIGKV